MIAPDSTFTLLGALAGLAAIAVFIERTDFGKRVSAPVIVIVLALLASQVGLIPAAAPLYDQVWSFAVPLAVALFLIKADLLGVIRESGRVLIAFIIGAVGVVAGVFLGSLLLDLGTDEPKLAAVFSATYIGGSLNFAAVAEAIGFRDASTIASAVTIDNVFSAAHVLLLNALAGWAVVKSRFGWRTDELHAVSSALAEGDRAPTELDLLSATALAAAACAAGTLGAELLGVGGSALLVTTVLMVAAATLGRSFLGQIKGESAVALVLMYLFFAVIGAGADVGAMLSEAPSLFVFIGIILGAHLVVLFALGAVFKLNYGELIVASLACIMGPPVAAAIAVLFGWQRLVIPGVMTGVLGYAAGNLIGVGIFGLLS